MDSSSEGDMKKIPVIFLVFLLLAAVPGPRECSALSLQEGLRIVTGEGWDVKIARHREEAAAASVSLARSKQLPRINLYGRQVWLKNQPEAISSLGGTFPLSEKDFLTYGISASQVLYDFGRTGRLVKSAESAVMAQGSRTEGTNNRAALNFIMTYLNLLEAGKLSEVTEKEVAAFQVHLRDAKALHEEGVVTVNDVLQAEVKLADATQRNLTSITTRESLEARINAMVLRPLSLPVQPKDLDHTKAPEIKAMETAYTDALHNRPDLQAAAYEIDSLKARVRALRADHYPRLFASGGYEYQENSYRVFQDNWTLNAGITFDLYSGGSKNAEVARALAQLAAAEASRSRLLDAVKVQIKEAYLKLQTADEKVAVGMKSVDQAKENLRLVELSYEEGVGTSSNVQDAVALLALAEQNYWRAIYERHRAQTALLFGTGADLTAYYTE